jgi:hypothetical protein
MHFEKHVFICTNDKDAPKKCCGKGADWTSGCIALANREMDELYSKTPVGTPVTIVGSLSSLSELLN